MWRSCNSDTDTQARSCTSRRPTYHCSRRRPSHSRSRCFRSELELRIGWWGGLSRNVLYNDICDLYQKRNPNITIVRENAAWADYWTKVATQAAGKNLPDITASVIDTLVEYAQRGAYLPMDAFADSKTIDLSDWPKAVVDASKVDGKIYYIPTGITLQILLVNQDMIKRAGLEPPKFETSWQDLATLSTALQKKLDKGVYAIGDGSGVNEQMQGWILEKGYQIANEKANDVGFPKEALIDFYTYWNNLYKQGIVNPIEVSSQPLGDAWADSWLAKGKLAMHWTNSNQIKIYQQYMKDDLVIMRNPFGPDLKVKYGDYYRPSALSIASNTKYPQDVAKFINFFVNDLEATKIFNLELGAVGPQHVADALAKTVNPKDVLVLQHFAATAPTMPYKMPDPKGTSAVLAANKRASDAIAYGQKTIAAAVDTFMTEAKEAYKVNT